MVDFDKIWVEKYRPKTLSDIILDSRTLEIVKEFEDEIPNLLFVGNPGTGKTTLAQIIVNDILKCNYLYINASDESGIDTIRHNITNFAQTKSFDGKVKVVILDEADGLTTGAQGALRNTMETFAKYCRFILTANYKHKIIPAVQSRCQSLDIKPVVELGVKRCYNILKNENIKVPEEQKKKFIKLVKRYFPDLRKTINELQKNVIDSELCINSIDGDSELLEAIYKKIASKNSLEARRYLIENEDRFQGDYDTLLGNYLDFIYTANIDDIKKKEMIAIIADHLYKSAFVVDKEINAFACLVHLENACG
jgi:DNA polymerase III delta prime subunit